MKYYYLLKNSSSTLDIHFNDKSWRLVGHREINDAFWIAHENLHKCLLLLGRHLLCLNHGSVSRRNKFEISYDSICACVCTCVGASSYLISLFFLPFSIDICQFSMTSLLSASENKERSISFRSIILLMIYAGTIILNLLAASIDDRTATRRYLLQNNTTTVTAVMEALETSNQEVRNNFLDNLMKFKFLTL